MGNTYLNKNTKFKCQQGLGVFFSAGSADSKTSINNAGILLDNCSLQLIGPPHPGQCPFNPLPNGAPGPCIFSMAGWSNNSNLKVSGKSALKTNCSANCSKAGIIKPFKPTCMMLNVNDEADSAKVSIEGITENSSCISENTTSTQTSDNVPNSSSVSVCDSDSSLDNKSGFSTSEGNEKTSEEENTKESFDENVKYALCDYKNCDKAKECEYLKSSYELKCTNESKNAEDLRNNIGRDYFDIYAQECGQIASTLFGKNTYSVAHHHIIPANQCFKTFPEIVKLANFYDYDINNANNGICLPTMNEGYDKQNIETRKKIAFEAMKKLGKQWHKGGHEFGGTVTNIERIGKEIDNLMLTEKPLNDYKTAVNELLIALRDSLGCKCRIVDFASEILRFKTLMDHVSKKIANKLRKFETDPKKSHPFFISKISMFFAYYDILEKYQDDILK